MKKLRKTQHLAVTIHLSIFSSNGIFGEISTFEGSIGKSLRTAENMIELNESLKKKKIF